MVETGGRIRQAFSTRWGKLGLVAVLVFTVSFIGAVLVSFVFGEIADFWEAFWWALAHLADPGALGEDDTWGQRAVGLPLVLAGIVILVGVVLEVLRESFSQSLARMGDAVIPRTVSGHVVFLGWSARLPEVIRSYALAGTQAQGRLPLVVAVAPLDMRDDRDALRALLPSHRDGVDVRLVFGAADDSGFALAQCRRASVIVVVLEDVESSDPVVLDVSTVRRTLLLADYLEGAEDGGTAPTVLFELAKGSDVDAATRLLPGEFDAVVADRMTSAILRDGLLDPAWPEATERLLDTRGTVHIAPVDAPGLAGRTFGELAASLQGAVPLAVGVGETAVVAPAADHRVAEGEQVIGLIDVGKAASLGTPCPSAQLGVADRVEQLRVLIVGWNRKVVTFLEELAETPQIHFEITSFAGVDEAQRRSQIDHELLEQTAVRFLTGSPTRQSDLRTAIAAAQPQAISVHSTPLWGSGSPEEVLRSADADALVTMLLLDRLVEPKECSVVVDLFVPERADSFAERLAFGIVPTTRVFASAIAWLAVQPGLGGSFEALFRPEHVRRAVVTFDPPAALPSPFAAVQTALLDRHQVALAVVRPDGTLDLDVDTRRLVRPGDRLLIFERLLAA